MVISIVLAQILSIYFIVIGIAMLLNRKFYQNAKLDLYRTESIYMISSFFTLLLGILMVTFHNIWVKDWPVIITIIGWVTFVKAIIRLLIPRHFIQWKEALIQNDNYYYIIKILAIILGLVLAYYGFVRAFHNI